MTANPAAEEPLPPPTVKGILRHLVKGRTEGRFGNMVLATKDDIAAVNARLDKLGEGSTAVVETLAAIGKWVQDTESRIGDMDNRLGDMDDRLARIESHLGDGSDG